MFNWFKYTEKKLATEIIAACRQFNPNASYHYDPQEQLVCFDDTQIYLGNLFNVAKSMKRAERLNYINQFIDSSFNQPPIDYDNASHLLIPRIKTLAEYQIWCHHLQTKSSQQPLLHYPLTENLTVVMGLDHDTAIKSVMEADIADMQLSKDEAYKHAMANLYGISDSPFVELSEGIYGSRCNDAHEAARLLLVEQVSGLRVKGNPVAFIPGAEHLFICGSDDHQALTRLAEQSQQLSEQCRLLTLYTLELYQGKWRDFEPPKTSEYKAIHNLHMVELATQYSEQKNLLDQTHQQQDIDVFVATHSVYLNKQQDSYFSACVWSEGVHSWLPKTDRVQFSVLDQQQEFEFVGHLSWQDCQRLFGSHMRLLDVCPSRYEVVDFPDKTQLLQLLQGSTGE